MLEPRCVVVVVSPFVFKALVVLEVVLKVALRNNPKPTMRIRTMTTNAEIPREIALLALAISDKSSTINSYEQ